MRKTKISIEKHDIHLFVSLRVKLGLSIRPKPGSSVHTVGMMVMPRFAFLVPSLMPRFGMLQIAVHVYTSTLCDRYDHIQQSLDKKLS